MFTLSRRVAKFFAIAALLVVGVIPAVGNSASGTIPHFSVSITPSGGLVGFTPENPTLGSPVTISVSGLSAGTVDFSWTSIPLGSASVNAQGKASITTAIWSAGRQTIVATWRTYNEGFLSSKTFIGNVQVGFPGTTSATKLPTTTTTAPLRVLTLTLNATAPLIPSTSGSYVGPRGKYLSVQPSPGPEGGGPVNPAEFDVLCGGKTAPTIIDNGAANPLDSVVCTAKGLGVQTVIVRDKLGRYAPRTLNWVASNPLVVRAVAGGVFRALERLNA